MYAKVEKSEQKLTWVNTIEYDVKSYQVKATIVNFTSVLLKLIEKVYHITEGDVGTDNMNVTQL